MIMMIMIMRGMMVIVIGVMMLMRGIMIMIVMIRVGMRVMMMVLTMQDKKFGDHLNILKKC